MREASFPVHVVFRNLDRSEAIERLIHEKARGLDRFHDRITSLRVAVEAPHHHHQKGNHYRVGLDIVVPGHELAVTPDEELDVEAAVRRAFAAAERRLDDWVAERQRHRR